MRCQHQPGPEGANGRENQQPMAIQPVHGRIISRGPDLNKHSAGPIEFYRRSAGKLRQGTGTKAMESAAELSCPRCALRLKQVITGHGVLWACSNCGGRAVGVELLRRTFTPESINPLWLHAIRDEGPRSGPCPSCHNPMIEVQLSDTAAVKVDVCRLCHLVWFDAHEVDTLVPRPPPRAPSQKARGTIADTTGPADREGASAWHRFPQRASRGMVETDRALLRDADLSPPDLSPKRGCHSQFIV